MKQLEARYRLTYANILLANALLMAGCAGNPPNAGGDPPARSVFLLIEGAFASGDVNALRTRHDAIFGSLTPGEDHLSHAALLSTAQPSGDRVHVLFADEFSSESAGRAFYEDDEIRALFSTAPAISVLSRREDWEHWNIDDSTTPVGSGPDRILVSIRGRYRVDESSSQQVHDQFFGAGRDSFRAAGYQRHHAFALGDELQMLGVWTNPENLQRAASDSSFASFLGNLFSNPPEIASFGTADWVGWGGL